MRISRFGSFHAFAALARAATRRKRSAVVSRRPLAGARSLVMSPLLQRTVLACVASVLLAACAVGQITIGAGPWIGTDTGGNSYNEEFQDWTHADCRALDGAGAFVGLGWCRSIRAGCRL